MQECFEQPINPETGKAYPRKGAGRPKGTCGIKKKNIKCKQGRKPKKTRLSEDQLYKLKIVTNTYWKGEKKVEIDHTLVPYIGLYPAFILGIICTFEKQRALKAGKIVEDPIVLEVTLQQYLKQDNDLVKALKKLTDLLFISGYYDPVEPDKNNGKKQFIKVKVNRKAIENYMIEALKMYGRCD